MFSIVHPDIADAGMYLNDLGVGENWQLASVIHFGDRPDSLSKHSTAALIIQFPDVNPEATNQDTFGGSWLKEAPKDLYYLKQGDNPADAVAFINTLANNRDTINLDASKPLLAFLDASKSLSPEERSQMLKQDLALTEAYNTAKRHKELEQEGYGQQLIGGARAKGDKKKMRNTMACHSVTILNHKGQLIQIDARKENLLFHGPTSEETFMEDAAKIAQTILVHCPMYLFFLSRALVPKHQGDPENGFFSF